MKINFHEIFGVIRQVQGFSIKSSLGRLRFSNNSLRRVDSVNYPLARNLRKHA